MSSHPASVEVIVLGTGTSYGVPMIGCKCAVCQSTDPCDQRTRASIWVRMGGTHLLVDTATELRLQCIANGIDSIDAVLTAREIIELQRIVRDVPVSDHLIRYTLALVRQTKRLCASTEDILSAAGP